MRRRPSWRTVAGAVMVAALVAGTAWQAWNGLRQHIAQMPGPLEATRDVVVPRGDTAHVAAALAAAGVIRHPWEFRLAAALTRDQGTLHAGEFAFPAHATVRDVLVILRTARPVAHRLTLPEGLTAQQITRLFDTADAATGRTPAISDGSVLPQTYFYPRGTTRAALVERAHAALDAALAAAWAKRVPDSALKTPRDALILASIVERETARPDERPHVAAVFLNRLHAGMRLQSDPTVVYVASGGAGVLDHRLTRAELETVSAYNTYVVTGLPPGPICAPGQGAIDAVLHPASSDDLYFVADGSGGHAFARTLGEHLRNVAHLRALTAVPVPGPALPPPGTPQ